MNKIFKVVWNRTIGSFVVTSELAKGRVKSSSEGAEGDVRASEEGRLKTLFRLTALSAALLGLSEGAWATIPEGSVAGGAVLAIGTGSTSANGTGSMSIGHNAQAKINGGLAIGPNSTHTTISNGNNAIAIGVNLRADGTKAIGIGADTTVNGVGAIAIGNNDSTRMTNQGVQGNGAIGVGSNLTVRGNNAIAVGTEAQAKEISTVAVGANTQATGVEAVAIGKGAQATKQGSIAIGVNTIASGVKPPRTDGKTQTDDGRAIAIGYGVQATGEDSIAIGKSEGANLAQATTKQSLAIGWTAKAIGATQAVAIGPDAIASGTQSTSIGNNTRATGDSSIAIGGDDWNIVRTKQVAAAGNKLVHQVYQELTGVEMKAQGEAYKNPFKGTTAGDAAVAIGVAALAEGTLSTAFGSGTSASGVGAAAFGVGATASQNKSVAIGAGSHTRTDATAVTEATVNGVTYRGFAGTEHITTGSQVSFGSAGYERQLKHVAPGAITSTSTDAINGSQLYALHVGAGNIAKSVANALGGGAAVSNDPTNNQGSFVTLPTYDVLKGSDTPNTVGNGTAKFNATPAKNVADALTNLNTYVNQGFAVKDNAGTAKGIVTPGESVQFADGNVTTVTVDTEANGNTKIKYDVKVDDKTIKVVDGKLTGTSQTHFYSVKNEDQTKGNYNNDGATGDNALAAGVDASATANGTTAVGLKAQASAESAIAVGSETKAAAKNAVVIGNKASVEAATGSVANVNGTTTGEGSVAVGAASKASGTNATAVGQAANAFGQNSFAGGQNSKASGKSSVAIGDGANATDDSSSAVGPYAQATKSGASAFGYYANAFGQNSLAAGRNAQATNDNAVALGNESKATGQNTIAFGNNANASQNQAMALGRNTVASAGYTVALGDEAKATAIKAIAFGSSAQATGTNSVATGVQAKAHADDALAVGSNANASGESAIALGKQSNAWKVNSLAFGNSANSNGERAIAIGLESVSNGQNAVSVGQKAYAHEHGVAIGSESNAAQAAAIAIGNKAQAMKYSSIVIGEEAKSNNSRSVVIGYHASATNPAMSASNQDTNQTVAIGAYANAWGDQSTAIGNNVDAKGNSSIAIGADDWDTVAVKTVAGMGKTVKQVYQDYTGDVMETGSYTHTTSSEAAVAIGTKSQAIGELSTAFGTGTIAEGVASAAFGMGAKATKGNSVAIGAGSTTTTGATSVNEATVNNLKYSGFAGGNSVNPGDQVSFGSKNYERQLKNVAPGEISNTSTDAINGSQLYAVQNVLGNTAKTVKDVLGGNAKLAEDGSITMSNIGNTGAGNIHDAINSVKETAEKGWKLKVNEEAGSEKIAPDDTVTVKQGKNIRVKRSSKELTIETADDVAFNKVTVGDSVLGSNGLNITNGANPVSLTKDGLNNGGNKVTNIADGAVDTDAASYKQVKAAKTEVQKGTNVAEVKKTEGTDGQAIYTVNAKGTVVSASGADNGLTLGSSEDTTTNVTTYSLDLSDKTKESLKKADSALQNIGVHVNGTDAKTLNQANSKLNFVDGTGTTAENKADGIAFNVNKSTLKAGTGGTVNAGTSGDAFATATDVANAINKAVADSEKTSIVAAGDNTHVASQVTGNETLYTVHADKTTVSVKADGGKLALNPTEVINSNQTKTTNYELDLTDAAKSEIQKGVDAKTAVDSKGVAFAGNNGTTDAAKLGETVNLKGDDQNVVTEAGADGIKVKLKDEITVQTVNADKLKAGNSVLTTAGLTTPQVTAGDNVLNGDGLKITNGDNPVSLTKSGLNNGGNKITKVAKGENADDAVNYGQLKELADKGLTFDADGNTSTSSKKLGERVGIKGGNNITTSADNDNVTVKLNDDITVTSVTATTLKAGDSTLTTAGLVTPKVTAGNSVLEDNGLTISNGAANAPVSLTKNGLDNGNNKITKVAKGAADTDAANVEQIKPLAAALNTTVGADGTVGQPSFTVKQADGTAGTAVHTVQDALNKVSDELNKGLTIAADNGNADKVNLGETVTYTSKDKNIVTTVGSNEIDFSLANTVTVGKNAADGNPVTIDGTNGTVSGLTNKTLGGTNFAAKGQAATEEQINAAQTNLANVLGTGSTNQNGTVTVTDIGETGKTTVSDAIKSVKETAEKGWNLQANGDTAEKVAAGETVTFKDGKNIKVTRDGKNITVATSNEVAFDKVTVGGSELTGAGLNTPKVTAGDSELNGSGLTISNGTAGSSVSLTKNGLNNGGNKITKVAEGTLAADSTDAVNGAQLYKVDQKANTNAENIAKGINVGGTEGSNKYALGDTVNIKGDSNIVSDTVEGGVQLKLADTVKIGQDSGKPVSIDGTTGTVSGLSNTTLGAAPLAGSNKAATEAQLDATQVNLATILGGNAANNNGNVTTNNIGDTGANNVHDAIKSVKETAEKGWNLKANEETDSEKIAAGDTVTVKQGKNIRVKRSGKELTVETEDDVAFNKVTVGNSELTTTGLTTPKVTAGDSVLTTDGLTIANGANPVSLTKSGLNNGGNKIANVAKGTEDTDGVNVSQIKPLATALNTTVGADGSIAEPNFTVNHADGTAGTPVHTVQDALNEVGKELNKGLNIIADNGSSEKVNLGDTVTYTSKDKNIVTTSGTGKAIDFSLAEKVTIGKDAANGGKPVVIDGKEGIVSGLTNTTLGSAPLAGSNKAATEAQLDATQVNLATILGGNAANNNGNVTTNNIGGTGKDNVHEAIAAVKETADKGWNLKANDETDSEKIAAGDTVTVKQGKNIRVKRSGKDLTVETEDDVEFAHVKADSVEATSVVAESVIAGNSVLTTDGLKIGADGSPSQVSLTTSGLNNGGNKIANVAKGVADTDAVNVSQLNPIAKALNSSINPITGAIEAPVFTVTKADGTKHEAVGTVQDALDKVGEEVSKGLNIVADNGSSEKVNLGDTVTYTSKDKNIVTTSGTGKAIDFSLAEKVTIGKDAANGGKPVVIDGKEGIVSGLTNTTLGSAPLAGSNKAATEAQLDATQVNLATILGGNAANNNGNVTTNNIGGTGKDNVHEAIAAVKETADKGWNLKANDETDSEKIAAGDTVTVKQGKNIRVKRSGKDLTVETEDDVEFAHVKADSVEATSVVAESVIAGNSVLTTDGLKIGADGSPSQVSLTTSGLNNGGNKIANVAKGVADTDAVNVSQLNPIAKALNSSINPITGAIEAPVFTVTKADGTKHEAVGTVQDALDKVGEEVSKGLNIVADNGSSEKVNLGDTVTYTSKDKNIVTTSGTGKAIDFSLAEKVTIGKDAANGGKPVVIDGKEGIVSGLTNTTLGSAPLAGSNKAATEAQLDATQVNLATILGGNAANNNGNVTTNNIGGTGKDNVHEAIAAVKETADKGWNLKANDETDSEKIAAGDTVTVKQGKNIRVKRSGKDLTVETEDDVEFAHVKADSVEATSVVAESVIAGNSVLTTEGLKIGADGSPSQVSLTTAGLNNGGNKIANVAKGTDDTDAVNVAQLNEQLAATEKTTTVVAGKNVTVSEKVDGNNTEYTVNADKTTLSQAAGGAVKVSEGAKDADGVTDYALDLTDEAKADIAKGVAAKDAVDNKGLTFAADNGTTGAKKLGDSLSVKGDGNILTRADENGIGFSLADKITVGKAGNGNKPLVIDGTAGLISGLSNTTLGGADFATKGQAASEEQLNAAQANLAKILGGNAANNKGNVTTTDIGGTGKDNVHDAIAAVKETADKGWNLNANDETSSEKIGAGDTVTFKEGKNVKVSRNGKNITVATSDDVSFDKVTVGDSVLTDNGLTVGNGKAGKPVSLTKDGLNNGGNKIANVAAGEADTDAVNVAQLKAAAAKATSKVDSGNDNIVVTPKQNADGSTTYTVATAPNLKADSFTAGDTVVNNDGVKVGDKVALGKDGLKAGDVNITAHGINAGNKAISNVAEGKKDTDAVNVGQLNRLTAAAKTEVEAGTNIASVSSKQGANGQTVYTVNADGASVSAGSDNIVVTKGNKDANNVTDYAVDLSKAVKADIAKGVAAKDAVDNKGISFAGDSGTTVANKLGDTVAVKGDVNITTTAGANGIQVGLNKDLKVDSVKAGDTVVNNSGVNVGDKVVLGKDGLKAGDVNITAEGINAGGKKVTGVAAGTVAAGSTDAVNGGQLHQVYELIGSNGGNVNTAPPSVEADGKAGLGNIKNITLVDNSNNPNVTNVTNETKIAQSNGYSLVTYNVEDQGMYVTNNVIEAVGRMNEQGIKFFHTNDGEVNPDVQARNSEDSSASGAYATAVGFQAASKGTNAIAIGKGAKANAENTIAIGTGNIVSGKNSGAIGDPTVVSGNSSYSIGNNNNVSADNAYALGSNIKATVNDSVYLGDRAQTQGIHTADAAKGEAYTYGGLNDKAVAGKAGSAAAANKVAGVVTVGNGTDETRQVQGVAAGVVSADSTDAINGSQLYYTNQAIANVATQATAAKTEVTAGKNVVVNQTTGNSGQTVYNVATADKLDVASVTAGGVTVNAQGVSIAAPTAHNPANTVSLSPIGLNNGGQRITNVAPAKEGTDAVNLNQLAGVGNALQNNIERVGKKAYAGVAGAIAQGSIPQVTRPGATGIGVGSGYYGGQSAMAIGVSAMSDGGNWVVKGNFSANTDGHVGVGAGALYQW
ncbi:hypothetical protein NM96_13020 [Neisseria mucosa]|uniref:YadA-like family protein n=1 Tax=Neisseria mucosa TaxID=488 RepID=UPI000D1566AF|nr:hypothetical protein NM96_13020 [Neisseria mucosa]